MNHAHETREQEAFTEALSDSAALRGMREHGEGPAAPRRLPEAGRCSFSVPVLPHKERCGARDMGQLSQEAGRQADKAVQDMPDLREELQPLHPHPQQDMLERMPLGAGAAERDEAMASQVWRVGPGVIDPWAGDWEADCPRTSTNEPDRTKKLKALGNAVVPQIPFTLLQLWDEAEAMR